MNFINHDIVIGDIVIRIQSKKTLKFTEGTASFQANNTDGESVSSVIKLEFCEDSFSVPDFVYSNPCGSDAILDYYADDSFIYSVAKPGTKGNTSYSVSKPDFSESVLYINEKAFPGAVRTVEKVMQLFPIRQLLLYHGAWILHSSQISIFDKGILFTAPSGTGKSTQAALWNEYEGAERVCNDRTLIRKRDQGYCSYGYPIDGSDPVYMNKRLPLGAVVVLRQAPVNQIERLPMRKALKYMIEQTVSDVGNPNQRMKLQFKWMEVLESVPVYLLACTPDQNAVSCLKEQLIRDGVIK